ncbi:hypothetical protein BDR05DRAFT_963722 [Suillus weaverae]|nr:hypothetical protein BDR05DRAFT_963722 [Suillus weaverae]
MPRLSRPSIVSSIYGARRNLHQHAPIHVDAHASLPTSPPLKSTPKLLSEALLLLAVQAIGAYFSSHMSRLHTRPTYSSMF